MTGKGHRQTRGVTERGGGPSVQDTDATPWQIRSVINPQKKESLSNPVWKFVVNRAEQKYWLSDLSYCLSCCVRRWVVFKEKGWKLEEKALFSAWHIFC